MSNLTQLSVIDNLSTSSTLMKLAEVYRESRQNPHQLVPWVSLYLKSGLTMRGQVLAIAAQPNHPLSVLFLMLDPNKPEPTDVTYILVDEIAGLTIHSAMVMIEHLSDGQITRPPGPPPSIPDLNRELQAVVEEANRASEGTMTAELGEIPPSGGPNVLHAMQITIRDLGAVLRKLNSEELGRQALREKQFKFFLKVGDEAKTQFHRSHCTIFVGVGASGVSRVSREALRSNIEEFL